MRGGTFNNDRNGVRCAYRNRNNARNRNDNQGFRCVREVGRAAARGLSLDDHDRRGCATSHIRAPLPACSPGPAEETSRPGSARSLRGERCPGVHVSWLGPAARDRAQAGR
jgi:hypothetical protein